MYKHKRGTPYPPAIRQRVMALLQEGLPITHIAQQLRVSRSTVHRYKQEAQVQHTKVPRPHKLGGYRHSKLNRDQIVQISTYLLQHPKLSKVLNK